MFSDLAQLWIRKNQHAYFQDCILDLKSFRIGVFRIGFESICGHIIVDFDWNPSSPDFSDACVRQQQVEKAPFRSGKLVDFGVKTCIRWGK